LNSLSIHRHASLFVAALSLLAAPTVSEAQEWPSKQVSVILPTAAGGSTDLMARLATDYLATALGKPFVVINRPSAGGVISSSQVGEAEPDGHTILFSPAILILLTPHIQPVPFDFDKALRPVTNVGTSAQVVAIRNGLPVNSMAEFIAYAKSNPGKLNFIVAGANNLSHLAPLLLFKRTGIEIGMVAARGEPQAITELLAGTVDFYFGNASILLGSDLTKIKILSVGTGKRIAAAPDLPTISETVPGFVFQSWNGFFVPVKTPDAIVDRLRAAVTEFVRKPEIQSKLTTLGIVPGGQSKDEVEAALNADRAGFLEAANVAGIVKKQ